MQHSAEEKTTSITSTQTEIVIAQTSTQTDTTSEKTGCRGAGNCPSDETAGPGDNAPTTPPTPSASVFWPEGNFTPVAPAVLACNYLLVSVCTEPQGCFFSNPVPGQATPATGSSAFASDESDPTSSLGAGQWSRWSSGLTGKSIAPPAEPSCPPQWPYSGPYRFTSDRRLVVDGLPVYRNDARGCFLVVRPGGRWLSACVADLPEYLRAPAAFPAGDRCGLGAGAVCYTDAAGESCHCPFAMQPAEKTIANKTKARVTSHGAKTKVASTQTPSPQNNMTKSAAASPSGCRGAGNCPSDETAGPGDNAPTTPPTPSASVFWPEGNFTPVAPAVLACNYLLVSVCTEPQGCFFSNPVPGQATPATGSSAFASDESDPTSSLGAGQWSRWSSGLTGKSIAPPAEPSCPPQWPYSGPYRFTSDRRLVVDGLPVYRNDARGCFLVVRPGGRWLSACMADLPEYLRAPAAFPAGDRCGLGAGAVCYTEPGSCHCPFAARPAGA